MTYRYHKTFISSPTTINRNTIFMTSKYKKIILKSNKVKTKINQVEILQNFILFF